jgi:hypothetical protein
VQEKPPFINFNLLIFMLFAYCLILAILSFSCEHNHVKYNKVLVIWFLIKALILLINVPYIKETFHRIVKDERADLTTTKVIHNTYLMCCAVTEMALPTFLISAL